MKSTLTLRGKSIMALCIGVVACQSLFATSRQSYEKVELTSRKLNGPRLGMSYLVGNTLPQVKGKDIGPLVSQFGWHFEWLVIPEGGGPAFVTQLVPFLGGVEYSTIVPSLSVVLGIRLPQGFELGMGPQLSTRFTAEEAIVPSLVIAIGQSINFSGVSIPLNLAVSHNNSGQRIAFVFGYALPSKN
jgi:hypothetical protein